MGDLPLSVAFLFPGQGSQYPGMLHRLPDHTIMSETLNEASQILEQDVWTLDTNEALVSTVSVQLALLISGVAAARILRAEGIRPELAAGLSVGAFAAAVAVEALEFDAALMLVQCRARLMENAFPKGYGLTAVVGLSEQRLGKIVEGVNTVRTPVFLANINAPTQIVIAGSDDAMDAVIEQARNEGARTAKRLFVGVPSHCPLLKTTADELCRQIAGIEIRQPKGIYMGNCRARALHDPEEIRQDLGRNVECAVRWHDIMTVAFERGIRLFVELPPGHRLTDLAVAAFPDARAVALERASLSTQIELIKRYV
jgi:malonate decarboxylase epsilon subunit